MTRGEIVVANDAERRARPWLPQAARAGQTWIGPDGDAVRIEALGVAEVSNILPHRRGAASCPSNRVVRP